MASKKHYTALVARLKNNRFFSNTIWIILGQIFRMVLQLVVGMITVRYLGPSNYGVIGYTESYIAFFLTVSNLGFTSTVVNELLEQPEKQGSTLGTMIIFRICSSIVSSIAIIILVFFIEHGDTLIIKVAFLQSLSLFFQSFEMIRYWYQSNLTSKTSVKIETVAYIITSVYKIIILILQKDVTWFAFTTSLENMIIAIFLLSSYHLHEGKQRLIFSLRHGKTMLQRSYHFILSGIMVVIYSHMDRIMLKQMLDSSFVGFYSAAMNISNMWIFVLNALINSAHPLIITAKKKDEALYLKQLKRLYAAIIWIGIFAASGISLCSKWIVLIMYGKNYLPAASILTISVWYTIFSMLGTARGIWIICENKAQYVKYYLGIGAIANIILNYLFIPLWGASGAAAATLITQFITAVIAPLFFKDTRIHTKYIIEAFLLHNIR